MAPGRYRWRWFGLYFATALSAEGFLRDGGFCDGRRNDQSLTLVWRPSAHWGA